MKNIKSKKYAILVLAAGNSSRLGRPKQLVKYGKGHLLSHTIDTIASILDSDVHIILGAYSTDILTHLNTTHSIHINANWKNGMGNSIAFGINQIIDSKYDAVILTVCDQPYLEATHFDQLINLYENDSQADIIVSKYKSGNGPPTLFSNTYFDALCKLDGQEGAKSILNSPNANLRCIDFSKGYIDIDTEEDLIYCQIK